MGNDSKNQPKAPPLNAIVEETVEIIKRVMPLSKVVKRGYNTAEDPTVVFLQDSTYFGEKCDKAKFYVELNPSPLVVADIYRGGKYQYSVGTSFGAWVERFVELRDILQNVAMGGLEAISDQVESKEVIVSHKPHEQN